MVTAAALKGTAYTTTTTQRCRCDLCWCCKQLWGKRGRKWQTGRGRGREITVERRLRLERGKERGAPACARTRACVRESASVCFQWGKRRERGRGQAGGRTRFVCMLMSFQSRLLRRQFDLGSGFWASGPRNSHPNSSPRRCRTAAPNSATRCSPRAPRPGASPGAMARAVSAPTATPWAWPMLCHHCHCPNGHCPTAGLRWAALGDEASSPAYTVGKKS